jgi:hypothetical protein
MRRIARLLLAAVGVGVTTLAGCKSSEVAAPGSGRMATFTLELKCPWATASRPDGNPGPSVAPPANNLRMASTPRPPMPSSTSAAADSQPGASRQPLACAPASPLATEPGANVAPNSVSEPQTADPTRPEFLPEPLAKGTASSEPPRAALPGERTPAVPPSPAIPANEDSQTATRLVPESAAALPPMKAASEPSARDLLPAETSSSSKQALAGELPATGQSSKSVPLFPVAGEARARLGEPAFRVVNSKQLKLHFEVKDKGPAGIAGVELWYIHESREWKKPEARLQKQGPYVLEVDGEGLYGFKLIARNSQGAGEPPPQPGDAPQVWVLVDVTKPTVRIHSARILRDVDGPKLELSWTATDKNLAYRPVTLLCAEQPEGPWLPMVANLESTGSFQKRLPPNMPRRFLVRAEAIDIAGNVGTDQTRAYLEVETAPSQVSILNIN